jgi:hypothetical protein
MTTNSGQTVVDFGLLLFVAGLAAIVALIDPSGGVPLPRAAPRQDVPRRWYAGPGPENLQYSHPLCGRRRCPHAHRANPVAFRHCRPAGHPLAALGADVSLSGSLP